ncbi:unnamed protein product [Knipowitschia caucasica]
MALNYQASTLSLTLPISCQICLGKVRQPVICANNHVFCSTCMEMWLKKSSQCPTCRVPITAENPCREIIGGTNESDHKECSSTRKCLRKTRMELLFKEYEDEIESLVRENEELKNKHEHLESQLRTALDPSSISTVVADDKRVDSFILDELTKKLCAATDVLEKVKQDMDKLKEANKGLRSQNIDLVQENMRLKAEVASRSPQKFGRFTVAALEAKVQQYERNIDQLRRALERSDQYVEELESRIENSDRKGANFLETVRQRNKSTPEDFTQQQKINMMMRSLSDNERLSICSNPEVDGEKCSQSHSLMFLPSGNHAELTKPLTGKQKCEDLNGADLMPTTPSSAFRSLTLKSPGIREKKVAFKPSSYLRKLDFEGFPSPSKSSTFESQFMCVNKLNPNSVAETRPMFWDIWSKPKPLEESHPGPSKQSPLKGAASHAPADKSQTTSEASMDAAYLDKISELDTMLDGESLSSRSSQLSQMSSPTTDLESTLVSDTQTTSAFLPVQRRNDVPESDQRDQQQCEARDLNSPVNENLPMANRESGVGVQEGPSQTDELSFELLFDPLDENDNGGGASQQEQNKARSSSFCCEKPENPRAGSSMNMTQATKRKSYSPFSNSSPTKLSKLM